ncbi:MAG: efflux RND transporter permease subunit, partial [Kangiellaceae bacterium]|nr:efflux RND transporter permease subunit [Kangiellaceae bacterium]
MTNNLASKLGISGYIAKSFQTNPITPLFALLIMVIGFIAIVITPKEEDPQIDVTMVDVLIAAPGFNSNEVEQQVTVKAEKALSQMAGVNHIYSASKPGLSIITVQFDVGIKRQTALVATWNQVMTDLHWPSHLGVAQPLVKALGINDVPIITLTFWSNDNDVDQSQIGAVASSVANVLQRVPGTRNIELSGYAAKSIKVTIDPVKSAAYNIDANSIVRALNSFGSQSDEIPIQQNNNEVLISIGKFLQDKSDIEQLVIGNKDSRLVFLRDVARISYTTKKPHEYVQIGFSKASDHPSQFHSAVTISIAKKEGENAINVANDVLLTTKSLVNKVIPSNINYEVTRNSGETAQQKANQLIQKLLFATAAVVLLVLIFLGKRAALIVGIAVGLTLLITLFASWAWGFTLNRISLFALIFSIGILVDDAIVVVENIHRQQQLNHHADLTTIIPNAVSEVGGSTILATLTVIAALLP